MKLIFSTTLLLSFALSASLVMGQEPTQTHPGIVLFEEGKYSDAALSLQAAVREKEWKTNAALWNYLGLAYLNDGKVGKILVLTRLGHGLEENAVNTARQIKFEPKTVDGKPVASVVTIEYSFSIY